jgi:hypothetical protein
VILVDHKRRREYAQLLRHFIAGRITNFEYEDLAERIIDKRASELDPALWEIRGQIWGLYDDLHSHRLTGIYSLSPETCQAVLRIIVFLYTDQEYTYPIPRISLSGCLFGILNIVSIGLMGNFFPPMIDFYNKYKAPPEWPFESEAHYKAALAAPQLLNGKAM